MAGVRPISTTLEFIPDDPLYKKERPYAVFVSPNSKYSPLDPRLATLKFESRPVTVYDMRHDLADANLEENGFQRLECDFSPISIDNIQGPERAVYEAETERLLEHALGAEKVICYDHRFRVNNTNAIDARIIDTNIVDVDDPYQPDFPPRGAHNITFEEGPKVITKVLRSSQQPQWLDRKYRYRIVNTWRPLVSKLEDRPLAFCDSRTVDGNDLIAADQIYGTICRDIYYLKHRPKHQWYWLSHQTPKELILMLMYDTKPRNGARFCPHVSFHNPTADSQAPTRISLETRNIVITLASEDDE